MKSIELFAGAGGLGMGVSRAGFTPQAVIEWDRWCCDTIRENRADGLGLVGDWPEPTEGDVRRVDFRKHEGKIDLVTGGPPCQPFSLGGKHRAHADSRDMWPEAVRALRETQPRAFIFENVKGLTREAFATYFSHILLQMTYPELAAEYGEGWENHLRRLEKHHTGRRGPAGLEYRVVHRVLNAANYGVPQRRERVVFVGFRADLNIKWAFPLETHSLDALLWDQTKGDYWDRHKALRVERKIGDRHIERAARLDDKPRTAPWRTTRDAIGDLPDPEHEWRRAAAHNNHRFQPGARSYPGHTGSPLDEPAKTLKAGVHGVPGGENMLLRPDGSVRYFTVRESARLQTFPDNFRFHGAWSETMRQLGNAVPVELANIIARSVKRHLMFGGSDFLK
ncbi:DNA cytosine methyltransferase [Mesorhizobium sp. B292B1B]|uniref:DNA cytosine methyltransferase n=1 Tax=unclassified Mesorhizobium TaxID=325217 RepID=UPI00112D07F5|nr:MULTISPECIES: DNA cytosine methyltransferase [unclassified Mesorhizobium]MCA0016095.1 DNA cytosine methyltransferase [Mesorhizobium sp. B294B1A1]MCA0040131.1 DNA cytosine methyltransferase [Mesorhizobium sp. B292B1B]TPM43372.1 DNA cytosine methyltransferase [Mesorhizobium sp. B2-3-2]